MTDLGNIALWITLLLSAWTVAVGFLGGRTHRPELMRSAERAMFVMWGLLVIAAVALMHALLTHDFNVEYVAHYSSSTLPLNYTIAALWEIGRAHV